MSDLRSIDPTRCSVRHVVRCAAPDPTSQPVANRHFGRASALLNGKDGLEGEDGWAAAQVTPTLNDDGSFSLALANTAGPDGILHRERFAILTDDDYEPGEEYLEFWTDADREKPVYVGSPTEYELTQTQVILKGVDVGTVLAGGISSEVDYWESRAPRDALLHYGRLPVLTKGTEPAHVVKHGSAYTVPLEGMQGDCWTAEAAFLVSNPTAHTSLLLQIGEGATRIETNFECGPIPEKGYCFLIKPAGAGAAIKGKYAGSSESGMFSIRVVAHYDHIFMFVNGELVADFRRTPTQVRAAIAAPPAAVIMGIVSTLGEATVERVQVETLAPFATSEELVDMRLPGVPPSGGIHLQVWGESALYSRETAQAERLARLWSAIDNQTPETDRIDPNVDVASTTEYPATDFHAARWSGAIFLDLAAADVHLKLDTKSETRMYVGKTIVGEEYLDGWKGESPGEVELLPAEGLRAFLGTEESGWYPIVIEQAGFGLEPIKMKLSQKIGAGAYAVVPTTALSPLGAYDNLVRYAPHRTVFAEICETFGYQWRNEYRSLESGSFPGQLSARTLQGRQTAKVIDEAATAGQLQVLGVATDVIDGILADAAGIADPRGNGQLTAQEVDLERASDHMALRRSYESQAEITEENMLRLRLQTLLNLRSSPNEQIGVKPVTQRDLTDTFPLTGELARFDWEPGDGARLQLPKLSVKDLSPRQMTSIAWTLVPNGISASTVGFRSRPRSPKAGMRKLAAAIYAPRRTYQGSVAALVGSVGGVTHTGGSTPGASDAYSRLGTPPASKILKATLNVVFIEGTGWLIELSTAEKLLATAIPVAVAGRYDLTALIQQYVGESAGAGYMYARLAGGTTGFYLCQLEVQALV